MHLFIIIFLLIPVTFANLEMKPGLRKLVTISKINNLEVNIAASLRESFSNIPEHKKKMMMDRKAKLNPGIMKDGAIHVCYSREILNSPEIFSMQDQKNKKCDIKIIESTSTKLMTSFACLDGTSGDTLWNVKNSNSYDGVMNMRKNGVNDKFQFNYNGEFLKTDCGTLKNEAQVKN